MGGYGDIIKLLLQAHASRTWYTGKFSEAQATMDLIFMQIENVKISKLALSKKWQWSRDRVNRFIAKQGNGQGNQQVNTMSLNTKAYRTNKATNKSTDKATENPKYTKAAKEVLEYLNSKLNKRYRKDDEIIARLKDGYSVSDCKAIIDNKMQDPYFIENKKYLNPVTLFRRSHFDVYLNDTPIDDWAEFRARREAELRK